MKKELDDIFADQVAETATSEKPELPPSVEELPLLDLEAVTSSNIAGIGHDPLTNTLDVGFTNGTVYRYGHVSRDEYRAFLGAPSAGTYFAKYIRNKYNMRQVVDDRLKLVQP